MRRPDGSTIQFNSNAVTKQNEPMGTRVLSPVPRKLRGKRVEKTVPLWKRGYK